MTDIMTVANKQQIINKNYLPPTLYDVRVIYTCKYVPLKNSRSPKTRFIYFYALPKMINVCSHHCSLHTRLQLHKPEAHDRKSSVSNRFEGGLYYPVAVITPASPKPSRYVTSQLVRLSLLPSVGR